MPETETYLDAETEESVETVPSEAAADEVRVLAPVQALAPAQFGRLRVTAPAARRVGAALIDRLLPLPFLIALFWPWALVVLAYDLLRDAQGASLGKRLLGLETVMASPDTALDGRPCNVGRSLLRNLPWAGARLCYLFVLLSPVGFALDLTLCLVACLTPEGRHPGDRLGGTRVVVADRAGRDF